MMHFEDPPGDFVDITTTVDTLNNVVCGKTADLSPFALVILNTIGIPVTPNAPLAMGLEQNVPNPFNPTTAITYEIRESAMVTIKVYDVGGRHVVTLVDEFKGAGRWDVTWDARDKGGQRVASGVYFYRMIAGEYTQTRKMVLLK